MEPKDPDSSQETPPNVSERDTISESEDVQVVPDSTPEELPGAVRKLMDEKPESISNFLAMGVGQMGNPLHQKMNEDHISTVLDLAVKHDEREYNLAIGRLGIVASNRWFRLAILVIVLVFIAALIIGFKDDKDILIPLVTGILAFAGGFGSGWGVGRRDND